MLLLLLCYCYCTVVVVIVVVVLCCFCVASSWNTAMWFRILLLLLFFCCCVVAWYMIESQRKGHVDVGQNFFAVFCNVLCCFLFCFFVLPVWGNSLSGLRSVIFVIFPSSRLYLHVSGSNHEVS